MYFEKYLENIRPKLAMESVVQFRQKLDNEMRAVNPYRISGIFNFFLH